MNTMGKNPWQNTWVKTILAFIALTCLSLVSVRAQYSIDWFAIDGGGGTSTGGVFAVSGTIGQPDAGEMSGGNYSLAGGFWGASQTPPPVPTVIQLWVVGHEVRLRFTGIPGRIYYVERAHSVTGLWHRLAAITMPIGGVVEFSDITAFFSSQSFYRTSTP